ncbi:MAG: hypothetical protein ACFE8E_02570 [Candidatus Hodarchaeota archaeon]
MNDKLILERDLLRVSIEEHKDFTSEIIEVKFNNLWIPVLGSNGGFSTLNYWEKKIRHTKKTVFLKSKKKKLYYTIDDNDFFLNLDYCLEEDNILHIRYKLSNKKIFNISKLLMNYSILLGDKPDFTWVPHLRPERGCIIGDHVFRSPVLIYKKGEIAFAFIPDLKTLEKNHPFQSFMDFNLIPEDGTKIPQISYGFGNYHPTPHIFFKHDPSKTWKIEKDTDLTLRYYIIIFIKKNVSEILQSINRFFWQKYIRKNLYGSLNPQVLPYEINVREGFDAIFQRHKYWGTFQIDQKKCGGIWQRSWAGTKKRSIEFIKPEDLENHRQRNSTETASSDTGIHKMINELIYDTEKVKWFDKYTLKHAFVPRTAEIWNNAWFLNIRTAYSLRYFGKEWNDNELIEKGNLILNTLLNLPRINGIFPSIIFPAAPDSSTISYIKGSKAYLYSDEYNLIDASLAMYWALKYYNDFDEKEEIIEKSKDLYEFISEIWKKTTKIPVFISISEEDIRINDALLNSASSGAVLMFLTELYKKTKNQEIILIAQKIADFIQEHIIPENKWHDFEPFFSCTKFPVNFFDNYTNSHVMNTLCIYWCAEGFKELYKITENVDYLNVGEHILAVLSLFQQVWNMPYISYNTFGGFGVQNADAELSDARQALFVRTYMDYYLLTENEEYMERGLAALRASWALQLLRQYEGICPGNIRDISTIDTVDKGAMYENYGHTGSDYRVHGQITFDWGVGTAAMATAYAKSNFSDLFIDFKRKFVFGIDGILIKSFEFKENRINVIYEKLPEKNQIIVKSRGNPYSGVELFLNELSFGVIKSKLLESGFKIDIRQ